MNSVIDSATAKTATSTKRNVSFNIVTLDGKPTLSALGNGRMSPAMNELWRDSQRLLGFTVEQAFVTAEALGREYGKVLSEGQVTIKYGKLSKDGYRSLGQTVDACKVKDTPALMCGHICQQLDKLRKEGLVVNDVTIKAETLSVIQDWADNIGRED